MAIARALPFVLAVGVTGCGGCVDAGGSRRQPDPAPAAGSGAAGEGVIYRRTTRPSPPVPTLLPRPLDRGDGG